MDKRLEKRHKRQVSRARAKAKVSEPDVRTPEQVAAAKEVSGAGRYRDTNPWPTLHSGIAGEKSDAEGSDIAGKKSEDHEA